MKPKLIFDNFGADAMRLYLIDSPLVKGQSLKFAKSGLTDVVKDVFLPLYNSYKFLIQNIQRYETAHKKNFVFDFDQRVQDHRAACIHIHEISINAGVFSIIW